MIERQTIRAFVGEVVRRFQSKCGVLFGSSANRFLSLAVSGHIPCLHHFPEWTPTWSTRTFFLGFTID